MRSIRKRLPEFLYHGTSAKFLDRILVSGIVPRGETGESNWKHSVESNPKCVYLTTTYPVHFAWNATDEDAGIILEIPTRNLRIDRLLPDEDFLEQATRDDSKFDFMGKDMLKRTEHFRDYAYQRAFRREVVIKSINGMGTICHDGPIEISRISRIATIPLDVLVRMVARNFDGQVSIEHHKFLGELYREGVRLIFDRGEPSEAAKFFGIAPDPELLQFITIHSPAELRWLREIKA